MSGRVRERRGGWRAACAVTLGRLVIELLARTWRYRVENAGGLDALRVKRRPVIIVLWHGQMLPLLWHHRRQGITVLVSEHADGEIIARVLEALGYRTVRGSTSRGAERALLGMIRVVKEGGDAAFTPDGPRGPAGTVAPGALIVAQRTGAPIIPIAARAHSAWRLRSWDAFLIPKPFARVTVAYADPMYLTAGSARAAAGEASRLENTLKRLGAPAHG